MKKLIITIALAALGAFAWWTISPLFITTEVQDELDPEIAALLAEDSEVTTSGRALTLTTDSEVNEEPVTETKTLIDPTSEILTASETQTDTPAEPVITGPFPITDTPGHVATGFIRVITTAEETLVRYEDYDGTNGPDLKVYLTNDLEDIDGSVSLGDAKGNKGNINYTVPNDVDVDGFKYVVTWCEAFGVLFDYAEIN